MTKLKTIKDFKRGLLELKSLEESNLSKSELKIISDMDTNKSYTSIRELREEAIKWLREDVEVFGINHMAVQMWLERFNLTEEDLK